MTAPPTAGPVRLSPGEALPLIMEGRCPPDATVTGTLTIWDDTEGLLTQLPERLTVEGWLELHFCAGLRGIPDGLRAHSISIGECPKLAFIGAVAPPGEAVDGNAVRLPHSLDVDGCPQLRRLPKKVAVGWSLSLNGCEALGEAGAALPESIEARGHATFASCGRLRRLPERMNLGGQLKLAHLQHLKGIVPPGGECRAAQGLYVWDCGALETIQPIGFAPGARINLSDNPRLRNMEGPPLPPRGGYNIIRCPSLVSVPSNMALPNAPGLGSRGVVSTPPRKRVRGPETKP